MTKTIHCAWLIRNGMAPQANQKLIVSDGILQEVADVPADERHLIRPLAILPGLVNAHTHLEFSGLKRPLDPPTPFTDWIRSVVGHRQRDLSKDPAIRSAIQAGLDEIAACGIGALGEICTSDSAMAELMKGSNLRQKTDVIRVCFRELLGFTSNRVEEQKQLANRFVSSFAVSRSADRLCVAGLSPHAPYSVHPEIVHHAAGLAEQHQIPLAMHLAETTDEVQFVTSKSGAFVDLLESLHLWQPESLCDIKSIRDYLLVLKECPFVLAVHGNYFNEEEIRFLGDHANFTTVYCVRTHEWFQHVNHPWQRIEAAGGRVILGTDSRASNPDLSIWKELQRFCRRHPNEDFLRRLPMISTSSAEALGLNPDDFNILVGRPFFATAVNVTEQTESRLSAAICKAKECRGLLRDPTLERSIAPRESNT